MQASRLVDLERLFETDDPAALKDGLRDAIAALQSVSLRIARVNEITLGVSQSLSMQSILDVLWQQTKWVVGFDHLLVCRRVGEGWRLHPRGARADAPGPPLCPDGPLAEALAAGRAGLVANAPLEGVAAPCGTLMVVPFSSEQEVIGALAFGTRRAAAYTADDLRIATMLGLQLAAVFRNAWRFEQLRALAADLDAANDRHRDLLLDIMPVGVVDELVRHGFVTPVVHEAVTVVFCDFVGFTAAAAAMPPQAVIDSLDHLFAGFDLIVQRHGLEKLKTIGDAYMYAGGLPAPDPDHARRAVTAAMEMVAFAEAVHAAPPPGLCGWRVRVGAHSGPVVAGVIGRNRLAYDVWGDTVNLAARLESGGVPGRINISAATQALLGDAFHVTSRGEVPVKGKGAVSMFLVDGTTLAPAAAPVCPWPRHPRPSSRRPTAELPVDVGLSANG